MPNAVDESKLQKKMIEVKNRVAKKKARDEVIASAVETVRRRVKDRKKAAEYTPDDEVKRIDAVDDAASRAYIKKIKADDFEGARKIREKSDDVWKKDRETFKKSSRDYYKKKYK